MGHPAVIKAQKIAAIAVENGWKGKIDTEVIESQRITTLDAWRNDEKVKLIWRDEQYLKGTYMLFDRVTLLHTAKGSLERITGWPSIRQVLKFAPEDGDQKAIINRYKRIPFDWENDDPNAIINKLIDNRIYWYCIKSGKVYDDVVLIPKGKSRIEIKPIAGRRLFNFIGTVGFRSVVLDTIIQVGSVQKWSHSDI